VAGFTLRDIGLQHRTPFSRMTLSFMSHTLVGLEFVVGFEFLTAVTMF
jgi:hypothetical protein